MIFNISNIKAYEETNEVIGQTKFVDKDGNINTVDVYDGTTNEEYNPYARTVSTANMVNFNCSKAKTTTNLQIIIQDKRDIYLNQMQRMQLF